MFISYTFSLASVCTPKKTRPVSPRPFGTKYYHGLTYIFMLNTLFLSDFSQNWNESTKPGKTTHILEVEVALFRADRQTRLTVASRSCFTNAPTNGSQDGRSPGPIFQLGTRRIQGIIARPRRSMLKNVLSLLKIRLEDEK
jgi:hypothetical protein